MTHLDRELDDEELYFLLLTVSWRPFRDLPRPFLLEARVLLLAMPSPWMLSVGDAVLLRLLLLVARGPLVQWEQHQLGEFGRCSSVGVTHLIW